MDFRIGSGIFGEEGSPQPNSKYGGFLDSSGSIDGNNRSIKRRRTSPPLTDEDLGRDHNSQKNVEDMLSSTDKSFSRRLQTLQNIPGLMQVPPLDTSNLFSPPSRQAVFTQPVTQFKLECGDLNSGEKNAQVDNLEAKIQTFRIDQFQSPESKPQNAENIQQKFVEDTDFERDPLGSSLPLPQVDLIEQGVESDQAQLIEAKSETYDDFKQQFLNNHISTIEEDFDGENVASEFSLTQRTNQKPNSENMMTPTAIRKEPIQMSSQETPDSNFKICQDFIDFGRVYLGQPSTIQIKALPGTIFESELRDIVYFKNKTQETCVGDEGELMIYLQPNRLGIQEKYITAIFRHIELDIRILADVRQAPELYCAKTTINVQKSGVYKVPIRCTTFSEQGSINFELEIKGEDNIQLRKSQIQLNDGQVKAILLKIEKPETNIKNLQTATIFAKYNFLSYCVVVQLQY